MGHDVPMSANGVDCVAQMIMHSSSVVTVVISCVDVGKDNTRFCAESAKHPTRDPIVKPDNRGEDR